MPTFAVLIVSFLMMWMVGPMAGYHTYISVIGQTTFEQVRIRVWLAIVRLAFRGCVHVPSPQIVDVYGRKSNPLRLGWRMFCQRLCTSLPRKFNARAPATDDVTGNTASVQHGRSRHTTENAESYAV